MPRKLSNPQPVGDEPGRQERKGRRLLWLGGAGIAALVAAVVYVNLGHSRPLRISKETTYITEPLKSDGQQVDYFAAIRQATRPENAATDENGYRLIVRHLGKGPETEPWYFVQVCQELGLDAHTLQPDMPFQEPDLFLKSYVESDQFDEALLDELPPAEAEDLDGWPQDEPSRDDVRWMLGEKLYRPWTLDELPMMADWLEQNGPALDLIGRAVRRPTFYIPLVRQSEDDSLIAVLLPERQRMRSFARGLSARAHHRIGTGDLDGAIDDLIACKRLGRHIGNGPSLIDLFVGIAIEGVAAAPGIAGSLEHPPTKEQLERLLAEMDKLPPPAKVEDLAIFERFSSLDFIQSLSHGKQSWEELGFLDSVPADILGRLSTDWNVMARRFNELCDDALASGKAPPDTALTPWVVISLVSIRARSEYWANALAALWWPGWSGTQEAQRRYQCAEQVQRIVLAMLLYERDHGTLPPAWSADAQGNPLHSWRVLLLPYLGHGELYERIRLDEPWDSPHNRQFHGEAVSFYRCPSNPLAGPGETTYSVVVGPDMPFEAGEGKKLADFGPLSDDMILVVERRAPDHWMNPTREVTQADAELGMDDQAFASSPPSPDRIGSTHPGGANFGLRNGAVGFLSFHIDTALLKNLLRGTNAEKSHGF